MFSFEGFQINCQRSRHVNASSYSAYTFDNIAINSKIFILFFKRLFVQPHLNRTVTLVIVTRFRVALRIRCWLGVWVDVFCPLENIIPIIAETVSQPDRGTVDRALRLAPTLYTRRKIVWAEWIPGGVDILCIGPLVDGQ